MNERKENWYFTFNEARTHPYGYVKIYGTFSETRKEIVQRYGIKWSMQYNYDNFEGQIVEYRLYEVK